MSHGFLETAAILTVVLAAIVVGLAQEGEPTGPQPEGEVGEPGTGEKGEQTAAGELGAWEGEVSLKRADAEDFVIFAPAEGEKAPVFFGDTIRTSEGASVTVSLTDGTVIGLGPNSELVIERSPEGILIARLKYGYADVTIGSTDFAFVCPRHRITGEGRLRVNAPDPNTSNFFCIEDGPVLENEFGLITYLLQGQRVDSTFIEDRRVFEIAVHEYCELDLKIEAHGEGHLMEPGSMFTVDENLKIEMFTPVEEPEPEPVVISLPIFLEEARDEPYENAGDLKEIYYVSPKTP